MQALIVVPSSSQQKKTTSTRPCPTVIPGIHWSSWSARLGSLFTAAAGVQIVPSVDDDSMTSESLWLTVLPLVAQTTYARLVASLRSASIEGCERERAPVMRPCSSTLSTVATATGVDQVPPWLSENATLIVPGLPLAKPEHSEMNVR